MEFNCFPAFPTPIAEYRFEHHLALKKRLSELMMRERFDGSAIAPGTLKNRGFKDGAFCMTPTGDTQVHDIDEPVFRQFNQFLVDCARHFNNHLQGFADREMFVTESWINMAQKGGKQLEHYHCNCWQSGTYYLSYNEDHSPVVFKNPADANNQEPRPALSLPIDAGIRSQYAHNTVAVKASEGSLVVWPSHLKHFVPENPSDEVRISISMNFMPTAMLDGRYGFAAASLRSPR